MPISIFSDLVSLLTLHIYSFYVASARIFHWQLTIIISLFHLFRGKKRNILRNRIDSCDYDLDQLLLGTILFTLQFFLLPTVFVFYLTFASARIAVIGLKAALEMGLACLNHFPLFAVMLRLKDPGRLPGGICFELQDSTAGKCTKTDSANPAPTAYVLLKVSLSIRSRHSLILTLSSPSRSRSVPCSSLTSNSAIEFANTTSRPASYCVLCLASSCRRYIVAIFTVCSTACCQRTGLV
jgi:phosphatidylinositol glycan class Q protein